MSNYRDDTQETAVASSSTWLGVTAITEELARTSTMLLFGLMVLHSCGATATDEVIDSWSHAVAEQAVASDEVIDSVIARQLIQDGARASDRAIGRLRVWHEDSATLSDAVSDSLTSVVTEAAIIADEVIGHRHVHTLVVEQARAIDLTLQASSVLTEDEAVAGDEVIQRARLATLVAETAALSDEVIGGVQSAPVIAVSAARASDEVIDHLHAVNLLTDGAVVEDAVIQSGEAGGQAWTANADTWAMSRYAPYTFDSLAVIDGVLYGTNADGVFALDARDELVTGEIRTGKLDLGRKTLVHPVSAYLEYELDGAAEMDVTTTQAGMPQTYTYTLPNELAEHLTNGRFEFGRGLYGRHFSFALRMTGTHGHINDLSVMVAPTKRRV